MYGLSCVSLDNSYTRADGCKVFLCVDLYPRINITIDTNRDRLFVFHICATSMNSVLGGMVSSPDLKHSLARRGTTRYNALYVHSSGDHG